MAIEQTLNTRLPIAVIGAGPCGLAICKTLKEFGIAFECFESTNRVGGVWNVENGGSGYRSLHTNTSTRGMAFSDFPFPADFPIHPGAEQMLGYFRSYAERFEFLQLINFDTRVCQVEPCAEGNWQVTIEREGQQEQRIFSSVAIATGKYSKPNMPHSDRAGVFTGKVMHAAEFLDVQQPIDLREKSVLVVGLGSSAVEIASDLSKSGAGKVLLSARSGRWVIPKMIDGKPADSAAPHPSQPLPFPLAYLPAELGSWLMRRVMAIVFRKQFKAQQALLEKKLPEPSLQPWADRPTLSSDFIPLLQNGSIDLRPQIRSFDGNRVTFSDESSAKVDVILYATGYHIELPFIDESLLGESAGQLRLYKNIAHPSLKGLYFIGFCPVMCSLWPLAEQQSRWLARLLENRFELPERKIRVREAQSMSTSLPVICNFYVESLRKQAGGLES